MTSSITRSTPMPMTRSGPMRTMTSTTACSALTHSVMAAPMPRSDLRAVVGVALLGLATLGVAMLEAPPVAEASKPTAGLTDWPIERIAQTVEPNDAQRAVLDELKDATAQALDILKAACPTAL